MRTFLGLRYWPLDPDPMDIHIQDIAHGLAHQCRFNGQSLRFLSTAEHSVLVSENCDKGDEKEGLMHDAPEGYIGDQIRPIKYLPEMSFFRERLEPMNEEAMAIAFGIRFPFPPSVKRADNAVVREEMRRNMRNADVDYLVDTFEDAPVKLRYWSPRKAERKFLQRYNELFGTRIPTWHLYLPYWLAAFLTGPHYGR